MRKLFVSAAAVSLLAFASIALAGTDSWFGTLEHLTPGEQHCRSEFSIARGYLQAFRALPLEQQSKLFDRNAIWAAEDFLRNATADRSDRPILIIGTVGDWNAALGDDVQQSGTSQAFEAMKAYCAKQSAKAP